MKKLIAAFLAVVVLVSTLCVISNAFEIILPDDTFEKEEVVTCAPGDVNGDGKLDSSDLSTLVRVLGGGAAEMNGNADVDGSGSITASDCSALYRKLAGANV